MSEFASGHPRERLSPYLDDELPVDERAAVDRHLALCPECRDELDALHRIAAAFAGEAVPNVPDDLEVRVLHRLDLATVVPIRRRGFVVPASIAASIAAVGLLGVILWKQGGPVPRPTGEPPPASAPAPAPLQEDAPPAGERDQFERSKKNEVASDAPAAPPPAAAPARPAEPAKVVAPQAVEPKELAKSKFKDEAERQDAVDAARERQAFQGVAGGVGEPQVAEAPAVSRDERAASRVAAKADAGVAAGVARVLVCAAGTLDAAEDGRWSVADLPRGLDALQTLVGATGGRLEAFEPQATGYATVLIPRERYGEWIRAAKLQGMAGFAETFPPGDGDCVRQRIRIVPPLP